MIYILPTLAIVANVVVGFILYRRIKEQNALIDNLKTYNEIIDLNKIKDFTTMQRNADKAEMLLQVDAEVKKFGFEVQTKMDEMATFIYLVLKEVPKKDRKNFVERHLPSCERMFEQLWRRDK